MPTPAILCDIGNVLVAFDYTIAGRRAAEFCPVPAEQFYNRLDSIRLSYENGDIDDNTFVQQAMRLLEFRGDKTLFCQIWCEIFFENAAMDKTLSAFSDRLPKYLLSNTSGLHKNYLLDTFNIFKRFQGGVYSYSANCSKPEVLIFEKAVSELRLDPALTFYIDDLEPNIATANQMGFLTHLYRMDDHAALERDLKSWAAKL